MTVTEALRIKVKKYIDTADEKSLREVERILGMKHDDDNWWGALPEDVQQSVIKAIKEVDEGKGIPHDDVKKMYPQWFTR